MDTTRRHIALTVSTAAGGLLAAALLPMAPAYADDFVFTPDPATFDASQVDGFPPLVNEITGGQDWNIGPAAGGAGTLQDFLYGTDTETTWGSITNNDFLSGSYAFFNSVPLPANTQIDLANFGDGFANEWIDVPGTGTGAGVSDLLITPFGDFPLLGSIFADLGL